MKVLFDQNVPHGLREMLPGHAVATADEQGWSELTNGELLRVAEADGFEVMVSADQNLGYQQNLKDRRLAIVVLNTHHWKKIQAASEQSLRPSIKPCREVSRLLNLLDLCDTGG